MKKIKKWLITSGLFGLLISLSGCVSTYKTGPKAGQPTGEGWVYNLLVKPMGQLITYLVENFNWNYGFAIIFLTLIVRLLILPLGLGQMKKSMIQQEKMAAIKPQSDAVNEKIKQATTREEQAAAQMELQALYKENGISVMGGIGCLPLLVQMPIFTALFYTARYTPGISEASFFGIPLGEPSLILTVIAGLSYLAQSFISMIGLPEEQKKQMRTMSFMSPLMIVFFSFRSPAGVALYWVVGGIFSCIQSLITNLYHKPKIKREVAEEFRKNPPKVVVPPKKKEVNPAHTAKKTQAKPRNQGKGRNASKQQSKYKR